MNSRYQNYSSLLSKGILQGALDKVTNNLVMDEMLARRIMYIEMQERKGLTRTIDQMDELIMLIRNHIAANNHRQALKLIVLLRMTVQRIRSFVDREDFQ